MTTIKTSLTVPTEPWEKAKRDFSQNLSAEEKSVFETATVENVFYAASVAHKNHAAGSRTWKLQNKLKPFIQSIEDYSRAMDAFANASSLILCPIWGSIRIVLQMSQEVTGYQERLVEMFERIGDALPRLRIYETLFPSHEALLLALSNSYLVIIKFCTDAKKVFQQAKDSLIPVVACKALWKPFQNHFEDHLSEFRHCQKEIEKRAYTAHMIEAARAREDEQRNRELQEQRRKVERFQGILSRLTSIDYNAKHSKVLEHRHPGTGTWLLRLQEFRDWLYEPSSGCFVCFGIPGCGKTVICGSLIEVLKGDYAGDDSIICFNYCDYADQASLDPLLIAKSLIKQSLSHYGLSAIDEMADHFTKDSLFCSFESAQVALLDLLSLFKNVLVVFDGLDELAPADQESLTMLLSRMVSSTRSHVKVIVTSRREEHRIRQNLDGYPNLELLAHHVRSDIVAFVTSSVDSRLESGQLQLKDCNLKDEIVDTLVEKADEMFLWVRFQLDEICEAMTDEEIREALQNLPRDLFETYSRILAKLYSRPGGRARLQKAAKIFRWVVCARRSLNIDELKEVVSLEKTDMSLHLERIYPNGSRLIGTCGNLITFDRSDLSVRLAHYTVQQFLCGSPPSDYAYPTEIHFSLSSAENDVGEMCVAYLNFTDFETQLVLPEKTQVLAQKPLVDGILWQAVPLGWLLSRVLAYIMGRSASSTQIALRFDPSRPSHAPSEMMKRKYAALEYVLNHWAYHTVSFTELTPCWTKFVNLIKHKELLYSFRIWEPWIKSQNLNADDGALFQWAIENGATSFIRVMELDGFNVVRHIVSTYEDDRSCLDRALRSKHMEIPSDIVERLLNSPKTLSSLKFKPDFGGKLLALAARVSPQLLQRTADLLSTAYSVSEGTRWGTILRSLESSLTLDSFETLERLLHFIWQPKWTLRHNNLLPYSFLEPFQRRFNDTLLSLRRDPSNEESFTVPNFCAVLVTLLEKDMCWMIRALLRFSTAPLGANLSSLIETLMAGDDIDSAKCLLLTLFNHHAEFEISAVNTLELLKLLIQNEDMDTAKSCAPYCFIDGPAALVQVVVVSLGSGAPQGIEIACLLTEPSRPLRFNGLLDLKLQGELIESVLRVSSTHSDHPGISTLIERCADFYTVWIARSDSSERNLDHESKLLNLAASRNLRKTVKRLELFRVQATTPKQELVHEGRMTGKEDRSNRMNAYFADLYHDDSEDDVDEDTTPEENLADLEDAIRSASKHKVRKALTTKMNLRDLQLIKDKLAKGNCDNDCWSMLRDHIDVRLGYVH